MNKEIRPTGEPPYNRYVQGFHSRGKLPHLKKEGVAYFVTFRLADSLPQQVVQKLKHERVAILEKARAAKRPLTWHEEQQLWLWYSEKVESFLDAGHGTCWLRDPDVAKLVSDAIKFFHGKRYDLRAWVVMPNHAHAVLRPLRGHTLSAILHSWKSFTAKEANKILDRKGEWFWQKESYDHWIRNDEEHARMVRYTEANPVKANLCPRPQDWLWSSARDRAVAAGILPAGDGGILPPV